MKKALGWLAVTLVGTGISLYGNRRVLQAVKEHEETERQEAMIRAFRRGQRYQQA